MYFMHARPEPGLLIEPFGIETLAADIDNYSASQLLIEPFGIETKSPPWTANSTLRLLIEPFGIETEVSFQP